MVGIVSDVMPLIMCMEFTTVCVFIKRNITESLKNYLIINCVNHYKL